MEKEITLSVKFYIINSTLELPTCNAYLHLVLAGNINQIDTIKMQ